jgi:gliding motility-associated-like protein
MTLTSSFGQSSNCTNLNFGLGNFTNWTGYTWRYSTIVPSINSNPVEGIVNRRQTIMSDTSEYDANTGYALRKIPQGYMYSARLGDEIVTSDANPRCWQQSLRYTMTIDSTNALLIIRFALVLQYASDHTALNEPRFRLNLYDSNGNVLEDCSNYDVYSSNKNIKGFTTYTPSGSKDPVEWRDWTAVGANLLKYIGQTITIEFMSTDCTQKYHYGYAYFVAECHPLYITVKYCGADNYATLEAPEGFDSYIWKDSNGNVVDTVQNLVISMPTEKALFSCTMTSATGCVVTLNSWVVKYIPDAEFSSFMIDCNSNTVQFINNSSTNFGTLSYNWIFDDGNTSSQQSPMYTFSTSGIHKVTLILTNPPSACTDTLKKDVESFSPPLVGISGYSTYCPGLGTYIRAYGAWDYTWSTGSKADSIEVQAPGGTFWMIGRSSTGCISDTIYKTISEEPDWAFQGYGDSIICGSRNVVLWAVGADTYSWSSGSVNDSIITSVPGVYTVEGTNARGCKKSLFFSEKGYPVPDTVFSVSPEALDSKHDILKCISSGESGVQYIWDMGDNATESGSTVEHEYTISNNVLYYLVTLMATSSHGCTDSASKYIEVTPFIPNVFTPNGDGINDVFMEGYKQEIVDRNGLKIYEGSAGWNGMINGRPADPDTYFYLVYYKDSRQTTRTRKGYITLMR